jgi:hypothetical protein
MGYAYTVTEIKNTATTGLKIYEIPVDPAFRLAQRKHLTIQGLTSSKTGHPRRIKRNHRRY